MRKISKEKLVEFYKTKEKLHDLANKIIRYVLYGTDSIYKDSGLMVDWSVEWSRFKVMCELPAVTSVKIEWEHIFSGKWKEYVYEMMEFDFEPEINEIWDMTDVIITEEELRNYMDMYNETYLLYEEIMDWMEENGGLDKFMKTLHKMPKFPVELEFRHTGCDVDASNMVLMVETPYLTKYIFIPFDVIDVGGVEEFLKLKIK